MKHAAPRPDPAEADFARLALVEQQLADTSRRHIAAAHAQEAAERQTVALAVTLGWLLRSYTVLARIRPLYVPARVLDTGTPGVEVTR